MATCGTGIQSKLDPRNVWFGRNETYCVETVADVAGSLDAKYFTLEDAQGNGFYIWFDVDGGSVDPAPAGRTGIEVDISTGDSANAVAAAMEAALDASTDFYSAVNKNQVVIAVKEFGEVANAAADVDTGFTIEQIAIGSLESLGKTSGPISFSKTISTVDVTADQTGEILQDQLISGFEVSMSASFLELTNTRLIDIVGRGEGGLCDGAGTDVWGYGSDKIGASRLNLGGSLLLLSDKGEEPVVIWKTVPDLTSLNYSGVEQQVGEIEFAAYIDESKKDEVNIMAVGDYLQDKLWK